MISQLEISAIVIVDSRHGDICSLFYEYKNALQEAGFTFEFIYVLDGNFPEVIETLKSLQAKDERITILSLARSFGDATALTAGFEQSSGNYILSLPAYYQIESSEIPNILRELSNFDMVTGRRCPRIDARFNQFQGRLFNKIINFLTDTSFTDLGCEVRAFKRKVLLEMPIYGGHNRFFPVMASHRGFRVKEVDVSQSAKNVRRRVYRPSIYSSHLLDILAVLFLVKFTKKPLRFFGPIGIITLAAGGIVLSYLIFERLFLNIPLANRPALLVSSLFVVLGMQILALGLLGELIIFTHAKELKEYTVDEIIN